MKKNKKWFFLFYKEDSVRENIFEQYPEYEFTFADGFDDCIVGVVERFGSEPVICYNKEKMLKSLQKDGMTYEEAYEYFDFNIIGAFVGDTTPAFIEIIN